MRSKSFEGMACSIATALEAIGDRWALLLLRDLMLGLRRYDDLKKSTGITNATLTDRLRQLEQSGLIERRPYQSSPERHEYLLTARGRELSLVIQALAQVGDQWRGQSGEPAPLQFVRAGTGRPVRLALVEQDTGEAVPLSELRVQAGPGADDLVRWRLSKLAGRA
ncbi:MAG: helix-turn-helix transcriptional regulator [Burkholderiaceae bacterium]|jgi:DNA-binding HxlR family transcriptional regulator|nr:helix-turn-helix transcriptional regulator [Burkholderiaceae bacterium]